MIRELLVTAAMAAGATPTVIDGDTVKVAGVSVRLTDYDAPELFSPRCAGEHHLAERARDARTGQGQARPHPGAAGSARAPQWAAGTSPRP